MKSTLRAGGIIILALGLGAFVYYIRLQSKAVRPKPAPAPVAPAVPSGPKRHPPLAFKSNDECKTCHFDIWQECRSDEHSQAWNNKPLFPQDPKRTECVSCHASVPILDHGLDKEIAVRADRFEEGIGCIECHKLNDGVNGPLPSIEAPCNPTFDGRFQTSDTCIPCHAPHGTFEEWKASSWKNKTCQECHMPIVERSSAAGGPVRKVRSHKFLSARQPEFLQSAVKAEAAFESGTLVIKITNHNTGHNFPGEISNREVILHTRFLNDLGLPIASHRESMQAPPRPQRLDKPTTQIRAGETRVHRYAPPAEDWRSVRCTIEYKFLSFWHSGVPVWEQTLLREDK
ncbi:MAG TPA: cytochrome c3 family protein [Planctomycetota bacterium]|nr:cytochrome c3 family protein [Planctomycetota bacterium]